MSRRDVLKAFLVGAAGAVLPRRAEAGPKPEGKHYDRANAPVPIKPELFARLEKNHEALHSFCVNGLRILSELELAPSGAAAAFSELSPHDQQIAGSDVFQYVRLVGSFVRNTLIGQDAFSDANATGSLTRSAGALGKKQIHVSALPGVRQTILGVWKGGAGVEKLHDVYAQFVALGNGEVKAAPKESASQKEDADKTPEKKKLPEGAYAFDQYGQPYGWKFQNKYQFFKSGEKIDFPDLVKPFAGKEINGHELDIQLRSDAFAAYTSLKAEFAKTASAHLREIGFYLTEGFRTMEKQIALRKKLGSVAAHPGQSEHHLGTTIDIRNGKNEEMYKWLMGGPADWAKKDFMPRAIEHGFVPTVRIEPWHFRFVGKTAAESYWHKLKAQIIDGHTRNLDRQWWGPNGELMKK